MVSASPLGARLKTIQKLVPPSKKRWTASLVAIGPPHLRRLEHLQPSWARQLALDDRSDELQHELPAGGDVLVGADARHVEEDDVVPAAGLVQMGQTGKVDEVAQIMPSVLGYLKVEAGL